MRKIIFFLLLVIVATGCYAQIKKGSDNIYFYRDINNGSVKSITCYFSGDKIYYLDWNVTTLYERPYSFFKKAMTTNSVYSDDILVGYLVPEESNNTQQVYMNSGYNGNSWYLIFKDNMKTVIDKRGGKWTYRRINKEDDTQNNDIIYE